MKRSIFYSTVVLALLLWSGCKDDSSRRTTYRELRIGKTKVYAEIAHSPEDRTRGLMHRQNLPPDYGMLFVYDKPQKLSFWMKNTHIPLSIAFIKEDGTISNIVQMSTYDGRPDYMLPSYSSQEPVQYALEMPQGWFEKNGIEAGNKVTFPSSLPKEKHD